MSSISRMAHALKREKSLAVPRHIIFFDTETEQVESDDGCITHRLKLGWACYYRKAEPRRAEQLIWFFFTKPSVFWQWVYAHAPNKAKLWVIAHNLDFDFTVVEGWRYLQVANYHCRFFHCSGSCTLISVRRKGSSVMFVDSLNWFRESLKVIGDRIGLPKLDIDFDTCTFEELSIYCRRDVEILLKQFKEFAHFLTSNHISRVCYTLGSTAMAAYLFGSYYETIYIHNNAEAIDLERQSYRGGRTECFYIGELKNGPYYFLDVNSLYPFVMREHLYPVKYEKIIHTCSISGLSDILQEHRVIASVMVSSDESLYALRRKRTIFPVGKFSVVLTSGELSYALAAGHIADIETIVVYKQANIFKTFVDKFYKLRRQFSQADNDTYAHFCKILLNCLYGKFGQRAEQWKKIGEAPGEINRVEEVYFDDGSIRRKVRYLLGEVFEMVGVEETLHSFPGISAHVTGYARMYLWRLMQAAGRGHYFYCDTDSLLVDAEGLKRLQPFINPQQLGFLKVETIADEVTIHGAKDYTVAGKTVIKGISRNAEKVSDTEYIQDRWPSLRGMLREGQTTTYTVKRVTKHLSREYIKGKVTRTGEVVPLVLDDSHDTTGLFSEPIP